jgi:hypothetical protein
LQDNVIPRWAVMVLLGSIVLLVSCTSENQQNEDQVIADPTRQYEYQVGLGYGFLGKVVQVMIDDREVIDVVGTDEIEQYAQLQGTKILASGTSTNQAITVRVIVDGSLPYEQDIDLSAGMYVHVCQEGTGLQIYNTRFLVQE